ncbi:MAG: redoxin family protein [Candidatus Latescibacteria bacterium]|nr:redoxin family protein [Candidatus Latescibacterota bacterium]
MFRLAVLLLSLAAVHPCLADPITPGQSPPAWEATNWQTKTPLALDQLAGKVVVVRWLMPGCPFCAKSAGELNEWYKIYKDQGLVVVGLWFRTKGAVTEEEIKRQVKKLGLQFPTAYDQGNKTALKWREKLASASVVIDRKGLVRHIHTGGDYKEDAKKALEKIILQLLKEKG